MGYIDVTGQKFGMLTVIGRVEDKGRYVRCRCDCGKEKLADKWNLIQGKVYSCGCVRRKNGRRRKICNEDCFNCVYPDCIWT